MNIQSGGITYTPGSGYTGYLPGCAQPAMRWGDEFLELVKERAKQNAANKTQSIIPPNAPAPYDPSETFERRELTEDELNELATELANKYDPTNMTREEYDSFLDDLVERGILSKNELGPLGYHGFIVVGSLAEGGTGLTGGSWAMGQSTVEHYLSYNNCGFAFSLHDTNGDALAFAKIQTLWKPAAGSDGWLNFAWKKYNSAVAMEDVLKAMQDKRQALGLG